MTQKIVVLGTGGTIAGDAASQTDNIAYKAGERPVQSLLNALARGPLGHRVAWVAEQVAQIDSKDLDLDLWTELYIRCSAHLADETVKGVVITHGTDTLEETAWFLHKTLPTCKPVVLTCAMRPASSLAPDGPQNLLDALAVAALEGTRGVSIVCAGTVYSPEHLCKVHPYRLNAFSAGEAGPLGWLEEGVLRLARPWNLPHESGGVTNFVPPGQWPWVEILQSHAGANRNAVAALLAAGVQGLVIAATGNGTLHHALQEALQDAVAQNIAVRIVSKCTLGAIVGQPDHGLPLAAPGLSAEKARVSLMLDLLNHRT